MHCPTCGKETPTDQKFCRSCGMNLEIVGQLVAGHSSSDNAKLRRVNADKAGLALLVKWLSWGLLMFGVGMVLLFISKSFALGPMMRLVSFLVVMLGTGLSMYGILGGMRAGISAGGSAPSPNKLPPAKDTKSLPEERIHVPLPSVTERTTQLIAQPDVRHTGE
jgi:hypothetical protein